MIKKINLDFLQKIFLDVEDDKSCWDAVSDLWPLSPYLIEEKYLKAACLSPANNVAGIKEKIKRFINHDASVIPSGRGCCQILFVSSPELLKKASYLKRSFSLPLIWKEGSQHQQSLPDKLKLLADSISTHLTKENKWGLFWNFDTASECSLDLDLTYESGWASLYASLCLAIEGGRSSSQAWATGSWKDSVGIQPVSGVTEKLETVYDLGGKIFFVPEQNKEEAEKANVKQAQDRQCQPVKIEAFKAGVATATNVLENYLTRLEWPPDKDQLLEIRCRYYTQSRLSTETATRYYRDYLLQELAEKCRERGIQDMDQSKLEKIRNLISYVSLYPEGALFVLSAIKPQHVLLFYTRQSQKDIPLLEKNIQSWNGKIEQKVLCEDTNTLAEDKEIFMAIQTFVQTYGKEQTAFDVTPGQKDFLVIASWALDPKINPFLYLCHNLDQKTKRFMPGKERIRRLVPIL